MNAVWVEGSPRASTKRVGDGPEKKLRFFICSWVTVFRWASTLSVPLQYVFLLSESTAVLQYSCCFLKLTRTNKRTAATCKTTQSKQRQLDGGSDMAINRRLRQNDKQLDTHTTAHICRRRMLLPAAAAGTQSNNDVVSWASHPF